MVTADTRSGPSVDGAEAAAACQVGQAGGAEGAGHGALVAEMTGEPAGVDPGDAGDRAPDEELLEGPGRAPVARTVAEIPHDHPAAVGPGRLVVGGIDPVVADLGVGEGDDLAGIGRVGDDLLVAGEHGVEHRFPGGHPALGLGADGLALEHGPVGQHQRGLGPVHGTAPAGHRRASPSTTTGFTPEDGVADLPGQRPAAVGRVAAAAGQGGGVHRPGGRRVDHAEVGRTAGHDRAALVPAVGRVEPGDPGRLPAQQGQEVGQGQVQLADGQGDRRLQAEHARGGLVEGEVLELGRMGGVVGGDGVDGPVGQARP